MRVVAVSVVKNEADIIEAFVRHTNAWVDHHLVFDHDSTDGTREILFALQREGLRISLFTDGAHGNRQQQRNHHLSRLAAADFGADWIVPLDADEFLCGSGRSELESLLAAIPAGQAASLFLLNYYATAQDDDRRANPAERLSFSQLTAPTTAKVMIPRGLAADPGVIPGKGSHALFRDGQPVETHALPTNFHLAHFALRSAQHCVLRVVLAELQKLSGGRTLAGLDTHYRLGYQLLCENPSLFFETVLPDASTLVAKPIRYRGGALRYTPDSIGWERVAKRALPFLEKLAVNHGKMADLAPAGACDDITAPSPIHPLRDDRLSPAKLTRREFFSGFIPAHGWCAAEGPVPEAFLPRFHWSLAPETRLEIESAHTGIAHLEAEALTYSENQIIAFELNGTHLRQHHFQRTNQKERLVAQLPLIAGRNTLMLRYAQALRTDYDSRLLAVIFLSLHIEHPAPPSW